MRYIGSGAHFYPLIGRNQSKPSKIVALVFPVSAIIIRFTKTHAVKITISPIIDPVIIFRPFSTICSFPPEIISIAPPKIKNPSAAAPAIPKIHSETLITTIIRSENVQLPLAIQLPPTPDIKLPVSALIRRGAPRMAIKEIAVTIFF